MEQDTDGNLNKADGVATRILWQLFHHFGNMESFRSTTRGLIGENHGRIRSQMRDLIISGTRLARDRGILSGPPLENDPEFVAEISEKAAQLQCQKTLSAIDSVALVYAHAFADAALHDLLYITTLLDRPGWESRIEGRKVEVRSIRSTGFERAVDNLIEGELEKLERESMLSKADRLFELCKPDSTPSSPGYTYSRTELERIDSMRHATVHQLAICESIPDIDSALEYLKRTVSHFLAMVCEKYGCRIDANRFGQYVTGQGAKG